jgi:hypothetical protein
MACVVGEVLLLLMDERAFADHIQGIDVALPFVRHAIIGSLKEGEVGLWSCVAINNNQRK